MADYDLFGNAPAAKSGGKNVPLRNWGVGIDVAGLPHLIGLPTGHPKLPDDKELASSPIVDIDDGCLLTRSGTRYVLDGPAHPEFVKILTTNKERFAKLAETDKVAALVFGKIFGVN